MSASSPLPTAEPFLLSPSSLTQTPDDSDRSQLVAAWRGSNVSIASPLDSPMVRRAAVNLLLGVPGDPGANDSISSWSIDDQTTTDDSSRTTPCRTHSPGPSPAQRRHVSKRYRNELWSAIKSDYMYLMDEEIIDACKSTESEISSDEMSSETKVSYNEFLQQYKELTEWLGNIRLIARQQAASRSENYLTHMYHEEMLKQSPRQQLFNDYARQLMRRYPQLKQEVISRLSHVNDQWTEVMKGLVLPPGVGCNDTSTMLSDIREDVRSLMDWVGTMEKCLASLHIPTNWSVDKLREKLTEHQAVQKDIESRSRVVSAVLKLCEWLKAAGGDGEEGDGAMAAKRAAVHAEAEAVEQRWHSVWIQSLEWQLRIEDAIAGRHRHVQSLSFSDDEAVGVMRASVPPNRDEVSPDRCSNISAVALSPASLEGSDIIPFHESEYEELADDDLMLSHVVDSDLDDHSHKSIVERNVEPLSSESMEAGLDSALGRSVSNPSLHIDTKSAVPVVCINHTDTVVELARANRVLDGGYSSEGHSNEEPENMKQHGLGSSAVAADHKLDEEAVLDNWDNHGPDSTITSGIGTYTVPRHGLPRLKDASVSATNSLAESHRQFSVHPEPVGEETDDDFTRLNELPLDDSSDTDLLAKLTTLSDNRRKMWAHGRSLDSLAPLGSDRLFPTEKRVSSVEIIIDSIASSSRPSVSSQISRDSVADENELVNNGLVMKTSRNGHKFLVPSSCDASSEGTLSDSDLSDPGTSPSPLKSHARTKRVRRSVRSGLSKSRSTASVKSPTKRRMENLPEIPHTAASNMTRSYSSGVIDSSQQLDWSPVKRSKVCRSMSDLLGGQTVKKSTSSRGCRSDLVLLRRVPLRRCAHKLDFTEDVCSDREVPCLVHVPGAEPQYVELSVSNQSTDDEEPVVMPEIGSSLTNITWNEKDSMDDHNNDDDIAHDDWLDSGTLTDDISLTQHLADHHGVSNSQRRAARTTLRPLKPSWPDSDSDTEDFLNIVSESRKAFLFTESALEQFRQHHVDGTVIHDPAEYMGAVATCQTNVSCLLELVDALQSGTNVSSADEKVHQITDIVSRWRTLESEAASQQQVCQQLYALHVDRLRIERDLEAMKQSISVDKFDDIHAVETTLRTIQAIDNEFSTSISAQLSTLTQRIGQYQRDNENVNVPRLYATVEALKQTTHDLAKRCHLAECRLKDSLMTWYQLNELRQSLRLVLAQDHRQLDCLDIATDVVTLSQSDVADTIADLQVMRDGWMGHKDKLQLMESLCCKLNDICSDGAHSDIREAVTSTTDDLHCLEQKCCQILDRLETHRQSLDASWDEQTPPAGDDVNTSVDEAVTMDTASYEQDLIPSAGQHDDDKSLQPDEFYTPAEDMTCASEPVQLIRQMTAEAGKPVTMMKIKTDVSSSLLRRLLKYSLPLPLLLVLLAGLYLLCDAWHDMLNDLGLLISPQLKHVRGAPPI